jgi:hypothetical protein
VIDVLKFVYKLSSIEREQPFEKLPAINLVDGSAPRSFRARGELRIVAGRHFEPDRQALSL